MLNIVMMKWEPRLPWGRVPYTAAHVNNLVAAIDANLVMPARYHLITDDASDIDGGIIVHPIWNDGLIELGACYTRLRLFSHEMREMIGARFVSVDLDAVVRGPLDPVFDRPEDFIIWKNVSGGSIYCGSMFMMDAGCRDHVWTSFNSDELIPFKSRFKSNSGVRWVHPKSRAAGNIVGSDQAWISTVLGPHEAVWSEKDGVMSFKRDVLARGLLHEARIVFFHGREDPSQIMLQKKYPWIKESWKHDTHPS